MNYELAKQLKNAGFPQGRTQMVWCHGNYIPRSNIVIQTEDSDVSDAPTLEELIEVSGLKNFGLCRNNARTEDKVWTAFDHAIYDLADNACSGSTPTEAVAYLCLQLKKDNELLK